MVHKKKVPVTSYYHSCVFMFTKIFSITYLAQIWLAVIVLINSLEAVVVQPGWANTSVLSQQPPIDISKNYQALTVTIFERAIASSSR